MRGVCWFVYHHTAGGADCCADIEVLGVRSQHVGHLRTARKRRSDVRIRDSSSRDRNGASFAPGTLAIGADVTSIREPRSGAGRPLAFRLLEIDQGQARALQVAVEQGILGGEGQAPRHRHDVSRGLERASLHSLQSNVTSGRSAAPPSVEIGQHVRATREPISTEGGAAERPEVTLDCNECKEALQTARDVMAMTRRLALAAENALLNGDLQRARLALVDLQEANARDGRRRNAARESR